MPPMPSGDHSISNGSLDAHSQYLTYGPLFKALNGRTWVLKPHAVALRVLNDSAELRMRSSYQESPQASLAPCSATDTSQVWRNATFSDGACRGALQNSKSDDCLVVQNPTFTPTACGHGGTGSNIWTYPCPPPAPTTMHMPAPPSEATDSVVATLGDCPMHENVRWDLIEGTLRSGVPEGPSGPLEWSLCLEQSPSNTWGLALAPCLANQTIGSQQWRKVAVGSSSETFQLQNAAVGMCISTKPPPPPPLPQLPPIVNLFEARDGARIVVITSPGQLTNSTVEVNVSAVNTTNSPHAFAIRPGESVLEPLSTVYVAGADVLITVKLFRGAAVVRLEL